jgi:hypothetical protein
MSRASVLAKGQGRAEAGMADSCTIRRVTGETTDPFSGVITPTYSTVYTGKCRVQQPQAVDRPHDVGEDFVLIARLEVQLPMSTSVGIDVGDRITITAAVNDADLVGRVFIVHDLPHKSEPTARRLQVTERLG